MSATWYAPGRIEVFGTHTDYAGGNSLVGAVDRGATVTARLGGHHFVARSQHGEPVELRPGRPSALPPGHWGRYVETVLRRLTADFGALPPAEITVTSNLPLASGMSSSSSLMIGVAMAMVDAAGLREVPAWREAIETDLDLPAYLACVENGSAFKHLAGGTGVGTHGGSHDHTGILCGVEDHLLHLNFNPMRLVDTVRVPDEWRFVVATSGIMAEKTGAALDDYNRCAAEARGIVARSGLDVPNLAAVVEALGADGARSLVADSEPLTRRLEHFLLESHRIVPAAITAMADGDHDEFGEIAAASQGAAETLLRNQIPETSQLVASARSLGAWGSASFGAGFGGSVWALLPSADAERFAVEWVEDYRRHFPDAGSRAFALPTRPSSAAHRVRDE